MIRLVTCANGRYAQKIRPYLESIVPCSGFDNVLVQVGESWKLDYIASWRTVHLPRELNAGAPVETESCQHGSFLQVLDGNPIDVIIFTDGDMVMQRGFTLKECFWLETFPYRTISAGLNSGTHETLFVQATMIQPKVSLDVLQKRFGSILQRSMGWNIGVFVARRATYLELYEEYMKLWPEICGYFGHAARQQWLVNLIIAQRFSAQRMPYSFHANGHFGVPPGVELHDGQAWYDGKLVLFRHKL